MPAFHALDVSVIISTYRQPEWLAKVLWGFSVQTYADFEVVVADDGSGHDTRQVVEAFRDEVGLSIRHVWHEDRGFRKCRILNKAIVSSAHDYLVFTDGDCIPARSFLEWHVRLAEPDRFLSGGYVKLPMDLSRQITQDDVVSGRATDRGWLRARGVPARKLWKLTRSGIMGATLDLLSPTGATWNGHNASAWRRHVLAANGFDERMKYGGEDREFGERLENMGVRGKRIRHRAACVHLEHPRGYVDSGHQAENDEIRRQTRKLGIQRTSYGIDP